MYYKLFAFFILFPLILNTVHCTDCTPNACALVLCNNVENCNGPKQVLKLGGYCGCCPVCHTILGENEPCTETILLEAPPPTTECDNGLICHKGKCQKSFKALSKSQP